MIWKTTNGLGQEVTFVKINTDKKYDISLQYGNTQKTINEMDKIDVYYGLSEQDKNELLWEFINETRRKGVAKDSK